MNWAIQWDKMAVHSQMYYLQGWLH